MSASAAEGLTPILVTGGTGALGISVLRRLLTNGHTVTATWLQNGEPDRVLAELGYHPRLNLTRLDVTDQVGVDSALADLQPSARDRSGGIRSDVRVNLSPNFLIATGPRSSGSSPVTGATIPVYGRA